MRQQESFNEDVAGLCHGRYEEDAQQDAQSRNKWRRKMKRATG